MYISKRDLLNLLCSCHTVECYNDALDFIYYMNRHFMSHCFSSGLFRIINLCYFDIEKGEVRIRNYDVSLYQYVVYLTIKGEKKNDC